MSNKSSRANGNVSYIEPVTKKLYSFDQPIWQSDDGLPLMITPLSGISREDIEKSDRSIWRYQAALPCEIRDAITLGEGCTPLVEKTWYSNQFLFKLEWFSPTCSFKDKGASVLVSFLKQLGVDAFLEDSSGNAAAAMAAYAAAASMRAYIMTPVSTPQSKIVQMKIFGAEVNLVPGPRENSESEAISRSDSIFYASHNWHPFFLQGTKMTAYEIWEDLSFKAPDNIVIPVGAGSNVLGCHIGFTELLRSKQIHRMPKLFGIQPENCAPIVASFQAGQDVPVSTNYETTIATGTSIKKPIRLKEVIHAIQSSGGKMLSVPEVSIMDALKDLAEVGFFVEPTSAITAAALNGLVRNGDIKSGETTVVLLSGSGLKASQTIADALKRDLTPIK